MSVQNENTAGGESVVWAYVCDERFLLTHD